MDKLIDLLNSLLRRGEPLPPSVSEELAAHDKEEPRRLSGKEMLILQLLMDQNSQYGLELVRRSEGRLKRGTVYVTLGKLEEYGLVKSSKLAPVSPGMTGRKVYEITALGEGVAVAQATGNHALRTAWEGP